MSRTLCVLALVTQVACAEDSSESRPDYVPEGFKLQWSADFADDTSMDAFELTDRDAWKRTTAKGIPAMELIGGSRYRNKVLSPSSIALLKSHRFGDFFLEAKLMQTGPDYGHRDLCVFFGFQDPGHYYYAHFASKTDPKANQIFIVDDKPFTKISSQTTDGSQWGRDQWRQVRVKRIGTKITVWFDDMTQPAMLADDASFGSGYIGFGSYNDSGLFADVRIWAKASERPETPPTFFSEPAERK